MNIIHNRLRCHLDLTSIVGAMVGVATAGLLSGMLAWAVFAKANDYSAGCELLLVIGTAVGFTCGLLQKRDCYWTIGVFSVLFWLGEIFAVGIRPDFGDTVLHFDGSTQFCVTGSRVCCRNWAQTQSKL
jgi:hypothetical protein